MEQAINLDPSIQRTFTFGTFCCRIGKFKDALDAYKKIAESTPQTAVLYNAGYALKCAGDLDLAIKIYRKILQMKPDYEAAHLGLAFSLITKGLFKEGWHEHEWNLQKQGKFAPELRKLIDDNKIHGKTILLRPEGGIGDTLNFIRYAQRLKNMGAYIICAVQPCLMSLLSNTPYIDQLLPTNVALPNHDASVTLMSLPAVFYDNEQTIPQNIPYIFPPQTRIDFWKEVLPPNPHFKIGICWQPDVKNDISRLPIARRGIPLSHFYHLGQNKNVMLYSLQKNDGLEQLKNVPLHVNLHVFDDTFDTMHGSFVDTAAVMHHLDLIISTDTATAHLAGAMGKRVWLLLPYGTDWRWIINRQDTPWYPTMRIYRQPHPWDWDSVIQQVKTDIEKEFLSH
jgi:hypothetical protein